MDKKFSIKSLIIIIAAVLGVIATFLPWATVSFLGVSESVNGLGGDGVMGDGIITLILFIVAGVLAGIKFQGGMGTGFKVAITIISAIAAIIGMVEIANINGNSLGLASVGFGVYLVIIAGIAGAILPWIPMGEKSSDKKKSKK
ncbi:hypothetical protein IKG64_01015 [Candidatus Saccharibacteria bacterium]|nr:hypothetical protein [Candidatus Saccharibacteria bacterium]